jgi:predicted anti-sigma-YlaC factor YlaD
MHRPRSQVCDRARQLTSLRLDDEVSELERALLDAHLARCESCRAFADESAGITAALRCAVHEPLGVAVTIPFPRRTRRVRILQTAAAAALVVAAAALGSAVNFAGRSSAPAAAPAPPHTAMLAFVDSADELRRLRRASLIESGQSIPRNRAIPGESV